MSRRLILRNNIRKGLKEKFFLQLGLGILIVVVGIIFGLLLFPNPSDQSGYMINLYSSILSIFITVLVIDALNKRALDKQQKEDLILQMGSASNDFALEAVRILKHKNWLFDGNLIGDSFTKANLHQAQLSGACLQETDFENAILSDCNLEDADLRNAKLIQADLRNANLVGANLAGADLLGANLSGAKLIRTNDSTYQQNLFIYYKDTIFDEDTILPDNTKWTRSSNVNKFTQE